MAIFAYLNLAKGLGHLLELVLVAVEHLVVGHGDLGDADGEGRARLLALAARLQARLPLRQHPRLVQKTAAQMELITIVFAWFKKLPTDGAQNGTLFSLRQDNNFSRFQQELRFAKHPRLVQKTVAQIALITIPILPLYGFIIIYRSPL
jgi:hypothetical protein